MSAAVYMPRPRTTMLTYVNSDGSEPWIRPWATSLPVDVTGRFVDGLEEEWKNAFTELPESQLPSTSINKLERHQHSVQYVIWHPLMEASPCCTR